MLFSSTTVMVPLFSTAIVPKKGASTLFVSLQRSRKKSSTVWLKLVKVAFKKAEKVDTSTKFFTPTNNRRTILQQTLDSLLSFCGRGKLLY